MKRNGGDKRGSSADRRRRKQWMLFIYGPHCVHCGIEVNEQTVEQDRIIPGGSYARNNIQPSCRPCNIERGDMTMEQYAKFKLRRQPAGR